MPEPIKVGVIADQTGALSPLGDAQANTATLMVAEINASGGLLGRRVELLIEDSTTDEPGVPPPSGRSNATSCNPPKNRLARTSPRCASRVDNARRRVR